MNQALIVGTRELLEREPALYNSTVYSLAFAGFEIKETGIAVIFAVGIWLIARRLARPRVGTWR
jgi:uncharacterized membrane protein